MPSTFRIQKQELQLATEQPQKLKNIVNATGGINIANGMVSTPRSKVVYAAQYSPGRSVAIKWQ
jgi:hypothetical protein